MMIIWLADVLRAAGLQVNEQGGWRSAGHGQMSNVTGVLGHHTAGPRAGNAPSLGVVVNGRPGLPGPLCNLYLDRAGVWYTVAAGAAYHAGTGSLSFCPSNAGNQYLIGIEAESSGSAPPDWTAAQLDSYPRGVAALLSHLKLDAGRFAGHKEYAPTRKIDPAYWPGDMAGFRSTVQQMMSGRAPSPAKSTAAPLEEIDMFIGQDQSDGRLYVISGNCKLEFPAGGSDPGGPGHGNLYADIWLDIFKQAYPDGPAPKLVALNHDVVTRIPWAWSYVDGSARGVPETPAGQKV